MGSVDRQEVGRHISKILRVPLNRAPEDTRLASDVDVYGGSFDLLNDRTRYARSIYERRDRRGERDHDFLDTFVEKRMTLREQHSTCLRRRNVIHGDHSAKF